MPAPGDAGPADPAVLDNTGAARFRIPIEVPPGPGGFAPHLELAYSSRFGDGPFGVGWALGIPEIRCSDRFGVPDLASCAKYELDSVLLVEDPATPNQFHTFVESFRRVIYDPENDVWTVNQPDGTKLIFGEAPSHRIVQGGTTARWLLQRMQDSFGNQIFFAYDTSADVGSAYLKSVFYGSGATSTAGPREVRVEYEARPDTRHVYSGGVERKITRRAREIQVFGHGQIFRRYALRYSLAGVSYSLVRTRLSRVQEFGTDCSNPAADPIATCTGLPAQTFRYRDASGSYADEEDYRLPLGSYPGPYFGSVDKHRVPQLIGDVNGDGLPDRLELLPDLYDFEAPGAMRVLMNTGSGFSATEGLASAYQTSFDNLTYEQPRLEFEQIPAAAPPNPAIGYWPYLDGFFHSYAMCSVAQGTPRTATVSQELLIRGVGAAASSLADLQASAGAPSPGFIEPRPSLKLVDVNADGLADLVLSVRLSGAARHFDCGSPETPLAEPDSAAEQKVAVVFRNTGSGWVSDPALATGLPPFEEVVVKSSYQTELDEPAAWHHQNYTLSQYANSACANHSYLGFEESQELGYIRPPEEMTTVCHVPINLSPQFVDFNGDGYLDLAVIEREDPDALWTGDDPNLNSENRNEAPTRVWIQTPDGPNRWARAPQYDLPQDLFTSPSPSSGLPSPELAHVKLFHDSFSHYTGTNCYPWNVNFLKCGPNTYVRDSGVRLADVNGDGLADVVWNTKGAHCSAFENTCSSNPNDPLGHNGGYSGVLLNTGGGSAQFSAWCASDPADALAFGGSTCAEAAVYIPPASFITYYNALAAETDHAITTGWLADFNGDGFLDFSRIDLRVPEQRTWIQSPSGTAPSSRWLREAEFDFPIDWFGATAEDPFGRGEWTIGIGDDNFLPGFAILDIDGDGSADFLSDQHALLSQSRNLDLLERVENGRGGRVEIEYEPAIWQRDTALEAAALLDAQQAGEDTHAANWRRSPVVSRVRVTGAGFADSETLYRYARPRYCPAYRSDLGFRLVEQTRPDGSRLEEFFYQKHGRAGYRSKRLVMEAGAVLHRYQASWEVLSAPIPGSIAGVFVGRLTAEETAHQYAGEDGALLRRILSYDDVHGYNFVKEIRTERPTGVLIEKRTPTAVMPGYVVGRVTKRTLEDGAGLLLRDTLFSYLDLDGDETGPKLGNRRERVGERGTAGVNWVDVLRLRYDAYGNRIEELTPSPAGGTRSTAYCYDGDGSGGWCPSFAGQTSHSVMAASQDPLGKVTRFTPDPRSGIVVATDSDYADEPARRVTLDPFARPSLVYATPEGGQEFLVAENRYHEGAGPLRIERFEYVNESASDSIYSAEVFTSFGSAWKTITKTPSGYAGTITYSDVAARTTRVTLPLDCNQDPSCTAFSGASEGAAQVV